MTTHASTQGLTNRPAVQPFLWAGLLLTAVATIYPFVDAATTGFMAEHLAASYPGYSATEIGAATTAYLVILAVVGLVGAAGWVVTAWAVRAGKHWAPVLATVALVAGAGIAAGGLGVVDTSGDVGLAPVLGWLQVLPVVAGALAVVQLWRGRARSDTAGGTR
ncbi:hypothetical protein [Tessaracoccus rhinocerotis]|uniref:hypothetical protein n=1 Tax=Tessaracoccus rhinocerotis TaxID=1689449 RepID=UPI001C8F3E16|nr:hypothetical protein [Tessaracoccus rhinocerotis]